MPSENLSDFSSVHLDTKQIVTLDFSIPGADCQYPSEWFEANKGLKPAVEIDVMEETDKQLGCVQGGIFTSNLSLETAKFFLYSYGKEMKGTLLEDWKSFNRVIGHKGRTITPWEIVTVTEGKKFTPKEQRITPTSHPDSKSGSAGSWTRRSLALFILCVYRLCKVQNAEYIDALIKKMDATLKAEGGNGMVLGGLDGAYGFWLSDKVFLRMVSAIDMFLYRFADHPDSILRLGSLSSQYRDCSALLSFGFASRITGLKIGKLMDWIFVRDTGLEVKNMAKAGEETSDPYSYFPYQSDMGLVQKTYYSSTCNSYTYHWVHLFGGMLGHPRSLNARMNFEGNITDLFANALIVAWAFSRGLELLPQFSRTGEMPQSATEKTKENEINIDMDLGEEIWFHTQGRAPSEWYLIYRDSNFDPPKAVKKRINEYLSRITDAREGTIGQYLSKKVKL